jgi:hypothetical protein
MSSVKVKTLTGISFDVTIDPSTRVSDLKKSLKGGNSNSNLSKCKLFFNGSVLKDDIILTTLDLPYGGFLVAIPMSFEGKQTRQVKALKQKEHQADGVSSLEEKNLSTSSPAETACPGVVAPQSLIISSFNFSASC